MKILHTADWHLGAKNLKLPYKQQQLMKEEMVMQMQKLFQIAERENYDVVLICGDLFHSKIIPQKVVRLFLQEVENFKKPVLYIKGNHDEHIDLNSEKPTNFIILDKSNNKFSLNNFNFYADLPAENDFDESQTNILLLHGNIETSADNDYVNINKFLENKFDYIALGHIHQCKKYKKDNRIFAYSGSLFSNGFDEVGDKGYIEIEIENKKILKLEFVPFAERRYMICECDITGCDDNFKIINLINHSLNNLHVSKNDLVRVALQGKFSEDSNKSIEILKQHFDDYFYFEIKDQSTLKLDINKIKEERFSFKYEFISLVENSSLSEEEKRKICEIGLDALKGEDFHI